MKEYVCTVCGYVHKTDGELPEDFKCPLCGAGKDAFILKEDTIIPPHADSIKKPHVDKELSPMEISIICSNLARGCEKQYMQNEADNFNMLAEFFRKKASSEKVTADNNGENITKLLELIEADLTTGFPYGNDIASSNKDRGALRCQVWAEKVTRMLQSLLSRYENEGEKMLENTGVYVCSICGFVFIGNAPPELCPVCKVPSWKFEKVEGRTK